MKRLAILITVLLSLPLFAAQKRRAVGMPDPGAGADATVTVGLTGTVVDAASGRPVAYATITAGRGVKAYASRFGTFTLNGVPGGDVEITASRTGYNSATVRVTSGGAPEVNFRLQSRPTTTLKKADGTTIALDDDSVKFGYIVPFMNYQTATGNDFCTEGTQERIPIAQLTRITGMGTAAPGSCCRRASQRVLLELRDDSLRDATFVDSCWGYSVDVIARDHDSGEVLYVPFNDVSEIVFP